MLPDWHKLRARYRYLPMFGTMAVIFLLSHQPGDSLHLPLFAGADKIAHAVAYATLAATAVFAISRPQQERQPWLTALFSIAICAMYGLSDEFHQSFIAGRSVSAADFLADCLGATAYVALWYRWQRYRAAVLPTLAISVEQRR